MKTLLNLLVANAFRAVYDDFPSAFTPELWANESIAILEENMVIGNLVHRDFENVIASYGDTVNTRKPGEFKAVRKSAADSVTVQANTATNIPVVLDQHIHTSFIIKDADQSKAFKDLVVEYLHPAMLSVAREIDMVVGGQVHQFVANNGGGLGTLSKTTAEGYLLDTRQVLNVNKAYENGRNLILTPVSETALLKDQAFLQAYSVGDDGSALREASLGRKFGFDIFMAQNQPYVAVGNTVVTGTVNGNQAAGITSVTVDNLSAAIAVGTWVTFAGDDTPLRVVGTTGSGTPTIIQVDRPVKVALVDEAVVTLYAPALVNTGTTYPIGYDKYIGYDGTTPNPQVGQAVTFGLSASSPVYTIIDVDANGVSAGVPGILLDRALTETVADEAHINLGPAGAYNFAFHRNAIALVNRPLALPMPGVGARAGIASYNGFAMRVVMTYDGNKQGHLVTVDTLLGVKVLDLKLGAVMLG